MTPPPLHTIPTKQRPSAWPVSLARSIFFAVAFNAGLISINVFQLLFSPLKLIHRRTHDRFIRNAGRRFMGNLIVLVCQVSAPTKWQITVEGVSPGDGGSGPGPQVALEALGQQSVWISNHSTLADWLFLWTLAYKTGLDRALVIIMKASIKWVPIFGWGAQGLEFIFLNRSWAADRISLARKLKKLARSMHYSAVTTPQSKEKLALLVFPEGTLVTGNTRPKSKKFADKVGIPDMKNLLLPHSTGLYFVLQALISELPSLTLTDATVFYPGVDPSVYPEDHYNLVSILLQGVPPPTLRAHIRQYSVKAVFDSLTKDGADLSDDQRREAFDEWLRARWTEKDELIGRWKEEERQTTSQAKPAAYPALVQEGAQVWSVKLSNPLEAAGGFAYFLPVVVPVLLVRGIKAGLAKFGLA